MSSTEEITNRFGHGDVRVTAYGFDPPSLLWDVIAEGLQYETTELAPFTRDTLDGAAAMEDLTDNCSDDDFAIDELATRRARGEVERVFAEHQIPGELTANLFCFKFADLIGRVEIMKTDDPTRVHAHMTVSGPKLAVPVLDCWAGYGKSSADALTSAISQWATGPYWAYHDAFAHDHEPTYVVEREVGTFHVFEAPMQWYGEADADVLAKLGVTRSLIERVRLNPGADQRAHRLRWVHGLDNVGEVFLDDESRPELMEALNSFAWPERVTLVRHSAILLPTKLSAQREPANISLGETYELLSKATGVVDVDTTRLLRGALQHGIEREPSDERVPELCSRWSQLLANQLHESHIHEPQDAPMSRGFIEAYAKMLAGDLHGSIEWLDASIRRAGATPDQSRSHTYALAKLFCESALPQRSDAMINGARQALQRNDGVTSCATSSIEAPSAIASMHQLWPDFKFTFNEIGDPDPRRARSPHAVSLWSYKSERLWDRARGVLGIEARPAVAPPSTRTVDAVARVAEMPYAREAWQEPCRMLAGDVSSFNELLAVMVHPPPTASRAPWDWRFHVMTAAAFAMGHLLIGDPSSVSGHPLVGLLDGPVDWSTTAAVIALCDVGLRRPQFAPAIIGELDERLKQPLTPVWYQCYVMPARWAMLRLVQLS